MSRRISFARKSSIFMRASGSSSGGPANGRRPAITGRSKQWNCGNYGDGVDGAPIGITMCQDGRCRNESPSEGKPSMGKSISNLSSVTCVGLDLAKNVFQVHAVDAKGRVVVAKAIKRGHLLAFFRFLPACLVGIEACSSAHHWARELIKLGHRVKLIPPAYVKPY